MHRRTPIIVTAILAAGLTLSACGGGSSKPSGAQTARGPITVWYSNNEQEVAWGKAMVKEWNAKHADQQVKGQEIPAGKSSEEVIGAAITAGTAPCLVYNSAPSAVGQWVRQGGLVDLTSFPDGKSYIEDRSGEVAQQYKSDDGKYYQLPWKSNPVMIFYNKKMFAKAGLDPEHPKLASYADFLSTAKTLTQKKVAPYAIYPSPTSEFFQIQFDFMPLFAAATGGKSIVEDNKATFAGPEGVAVGKFWRSIYGQKLAGKEQYQGDSFADGKAAMAIVGPWAVAVYQGKVKWGSVPVPTKDGKPAKDVWSFSDAKNIGLFSACKNQATAWDLLKFSTSKEQDGKLLDKTGQMPLRKDLQTTYADYFKANPAYTEFGDQASRTVDVPAGPHTVEMLQDLRNAYTKSVIAGQGDVADSLKQAADQVTQLASGK